MTISLSEQLKKLRKEKGNTQDELASHLGITMQAISKWERGEGYPDITLLPAIASYYNVSIDDLLGVGEIQRQNKIDEYFNKAQELFCNGKTDERIAVWREAAKEFPNDLSVICRLMSALSDKSDEKSASEAKEYGERILRESTDSSLRADAIQCLWLNNYLSGNLEKAKEYANMAYSYSVTSNEMLSLLFTGDEAIKHCQMNIQRLVELIGHNTNVMCAKGNYTPQDAIRAYEFVIACYSLLYSDGICGFYHIRYSELYLLLAIQYLKLNDIEKVFEHLEKSAEHAVKYDTLKDGMFTSFMVNKIEIQSIVAVKNHQETQLGFLLNMVQSDRFAQLSDDVRMIKFIDKFKAQN